MTEIIIKSDNKDEQNAVAQFLVSLFNREQMNFKYGFTKEQWQEIESTSFTRFNSAEATIIFANDKE